MTRVVHWKKEAHDVFIGRPGPWGNPFSHKQDTSAEYRVASKRDAIAAFREWMFDHPEMIEAARKELRGKVLGCWCRPARCHGDVLAEFADSDTTPARELDLGL